MVFEFKYGTPPLFIGLPLTTISPDVLPTSSPISDVHKSKYDLNAFLNRQAEADLKKTVERLARHPLGEDDFSKEAEQMELITPINGGYEDYIVRLGVTTEETTTSRTTRITEKTTTKEVIYKTGVNVLKETGALTPLPFPANPLSDEVMIATLIKEQGLLKKHKRHHGHKKTPETTTESATTAKSVDIFYRRLTEVKTRNVPLRWVHCHNIITPYLTGANNSYHQPESVGPKDKVVGRLVHLINVNASTSTSEEITSVLHQLNNIPISLFHWQTRAIRLLFAAICKGRKHTFRALKNGILKLFANWKLNTKDVNNLMTKSEMIHPPCVNSISFDGSTKSSRGATFTTLGPETTTSSKCADDGDQTKKEKERR